MAPNISLSTGRAPKALGLDLQAAAFLDEEALEEVRRPDRPAMLREG
jgi:hypothetical protein